MTERKNGLPLSYGRRDAHIYAVYDTSENILAVGTRYEIMEQLHWKPDTFSHHIYWCRNGKPRGRIIIEVEDDE